MKLLILSLFWFPVTLMMLFLSLTTLLNNNPKSEKHLLSDKYVNLFQTYAQNEKLYDKNSIPNQDFRVLVLKKFFTNYKSPLAEVAEEIVLNSDLQGIDYALIPAISMQESQGCKVIPPGSHNCWGYGIYGNKKVYFNNYNDAVAAVAKTIKEAYIKRGLTNATLVEDRWTPSSEGNWSYSVNFFIGKIRELEKNYPLP